MNQPDPQLSNLPSGWKCIICGAQLPKAMSMVGHQQVRISKGTIVVCSACATPLILGDTSLRPLSRQEFEAYPPATKGTILAAVNGVRTKLKAGGAWSPYRNKPEQGGPIAGN